MNRLFVVPAKPLARAKQRLAPAIAPADRIRLALAMLSDVVAAASEVGRVWVLCSDEAAAGVARSLGCAAVEDPTPNDGLNASLEHALALAPGDHADTVVVLASDLACVTAEDLRAIPDRAGVVIAPSSDGTGTNALSLSPPGVITPAFGPRSRHAHERLARERGVDAAIVERPRLGLDVDTLHDLRRARELGPGPATRALLDELALT